MAGGQDRGAPGWGNPEQLQPGLVRIIAPNPSAMTHWGTNTYVLGNTSLCIIDPGPAIPAHLAALLACVGHRRVSHIVVTHSHLDHSDLSADLSARTGAPVLAYGPSTAGRSAIMTSLLPAFSGLGGEGVDQGFAPDQTLADGAFIDGPDWRLRVIHTPGHMGNHICLRWGDSIFSGDQVMGWASSMLSPPDGDLTDFIRSCQRLRRLNARILYPGHGAAVTDPNARIDWLLGHRAQREAQILASLAQKPQTLTSLTAAVYTDTPANLHPAAARSVFAHLIDLYCRNLVKAAPNLDADAIFHHA